MRKFVSKIYKDSMQALSDVKDGSSFLLSGFGIVGNPENSLRQIYKMGVKNLTIYTNSVGLDNEGQGPLIRSGQVSKVYVTFLGVHHCLEKLFLQGKIELIPFPQGSLLDSMRCTRGGLGGYYTGASLGTWIQTGEFPTKYREDGSIEKHIKPRVVENIDGVDYCFEEPVTADYALLKGYVADKYGNIRFRKTSRNFNPDIAGAAKVTVAEVEHIVDHLPPDQIHMPGIYVDRLYQGEWFGRKVERLQLKETQEENKNDCNSNPALMKIAKRLAKEFKPGMYINLGVGIPGDALKFLPENSDLNLHIGNGIIGGGELPSINEIDPDLTNADRFPITSEKDIHF